ncbi:MAG: class I SAM-dependent methyltransferase [Opitutae bacterium]|nr:class I SAM-dependent methyltransferase [Opitutae bacterium]
MNHKSAFWRKVWHDHARQNRRADPMTRVMRTRDGQPISAIQWKREANHILRVAGVRSTDRVLELCCGNGALTEELALRCQSVVAVDYVSALVAELREKSLPNVSCRCADARQLTFSSEAFDVVLVCAGIQYFTDTEAAKFVLDAFRWLKPGGRICLVDVPDNRKLWRYVRSNEKRRLYFGRILAGRQLVGTWYDERWFLNLADYVGYRSAKIIRQPSYMMNHFYRFDLLLKK